MKVTVTRVRIAGPTAFPIENSLYHGPMVQASFEVDIDYEGAQDARIDARHFAEIMDTMVGIRDQVAAELEPWNEKIDGA